jgi:protein-disulfide isomerase
MAYEREQQKRRERRRRQYMVIGGVIGVVILALGVGIGVALSSKTTTYAFASPSGAVVDQYSDASGKAEAITYGDATAPVTMSVYEDFRCPYCQMLETQASSVYKQYVQQGKVRVLFHIVTLIDSNDGGTGSQVAGNAAACAQQAGKFDAYHDILYQNQPSETTDSYSSTSTLITLAKKVPGLDTPTFESCVKNGTYNGLVQQNWNDFQKLFPSPGTPTVLLNGTQVQSNSLFTTSGGSEAANSAGLKSAIDAALAKATKSPSPSASATGSTSPDTTATEPNTATSTPTK